MSSPPVTVYLIDDDKGGVLRNVESVSAASDPLGGYLIQIFLSQHRPDQYYVVRVFNSVTGASIPVDRIVTTVDPDTPAIWDANFYVG